MFQQLLDGCLQRQQASNHDESFAVRTDDSVSEEKIRVEPNCQIFDHGAEVSFHDHTTPADVFSTDSNEHPPFVSILQDPLFLQRCTHSEEGRAAAAAAAREADPFHDDWPYWDQTSTRSAIQHGT